VSPEKEEDAGKKNLSLPARLWDLPVVFEPVQSSAQTTLPIRVGESIVSAWEVPRRSKEVRAFDN